MAARYRVIHETRYSYSTSVTSARQLAHLSPRVTSWQHVLSHRLEIEPQPSEIETDRDFFGNEIVRLSIDRAHDTLAARAESIVEVEEHAPANDTSSPPWEAALGAPGVWGPGVELDVEQYRVASPAVPLLAASREYARTSLRAGRPWLEAILDLTRRIKADFSYDTKATTVATRVAEVLEHRSGVCQDFAHLMLSCLRSNGLPARYVSGYVLNVAQPERQRTTGADASHAWVAAYCPALGWVAFDPTNGKIADTEFVTLGWGREFSDVTPLRGVVLGAASQTLSVAVSVESIGASEATTGVTAAQIDRR